MIKTENMNTSTIFLVVLTSLMSFVFATHLLLLDKSGLPLWENRIVLAYLLNTTLAIIIYFVLFFSRKKYLHVLGFFFMGGSLIKFALFFIFFNPAYKSDDKITLLEFAAFFVPYLVSLVVEIIFLAKLLNQGNEKK